MQMIKILTKHLLKKVWDRKPDFIVGGRENPYLFRWWIIPRNKWFNIYLHCFLQSDDDRALHDHPWTNCSIILQGKYAEHTIADGGIKKREILEEGTIRFRWSGKKAHRIEIFDGPCWTLFITGPVYRTWGFHCPDEGWIPWFRFVSDKDAGQTGRGCEG